MTNKRLIQIAKKIEKIKNELVLIGPMRPGSLTQQYGDPKQRTGAYYQLSYTHEMKSRTDYVRKEYVGDIRKELDNYKRFKKLSIEWVALSIEYSKLKIKLSKEIE